MFLLGFLVGAVSTVVVLCVWAVKRFEAIDADMKVLKMRD